MRETYTFKDRTTEVERAMLPVLIQIYDRDMLDQWSRPWFDKIARDIEALPPNVAANLFQDHFNRLAKAYLPLSLAHLAAARQRLRELKLPDDQVDYWTDQFICDFIEPLSEAYIAQQMREGIDPATGQPMPPGWLQLDVDEIWQAERRDLEIRIAASRGDNVTSFRKP